MTQCFLIDDDLDDQEIFSIAINEVDPTIVCFFSNNGSEGVAKLNQSTSFVPDYIFIDLNMPRMNGVECLRQIKKLPHLAHSELILYSTSIDEKSKKESWLLGVTRLLIKPVSLNALKVELQEIFNGNKNQTTANS